MNVQSIVINLDKGSFEVTYIDGLGTLNYETINLFELEYYVNQLLLNGSGTGFFQMLKSGNLITINKDGISEGKSIIFLTTSAVGISTIVPLTSDDNLTSTSPFTSKTPAVIVFNNGTNILTNIKFRLPQLGSGTFAGDYTVNLNTGSAMGAVTSVDSNPYWNVTIASITVGADTTASVLITSQV